MTTTDYELATRDRILLRGALIGPTGSGKTHGALQIATQLAPVDEVELIDTENERAKLEVDVFGQFRHRKLRDRTPPGYTAAMNRAYAQGAKVVILDSVSPEWKDCLSKADRFGDWRNVRPPHEDWIEAMVNAPSHLIVTIRAKMKYLVTEVEEGGRKRQQIDPVGMGPIQDDNLPYEFDVVAYLDRNHLATFSNRCRPLDGKTMDMHEAAPIIAEWLGVGEPPPEAELELVENLRGLLREEGFADEAIEERFAIARGQNRGALHPDYVERNTRAAEERLEAAKAGAGEQTELAGAEA